MHARIVEVGPRDGLQNEDFAIPTDLKLRFIASLAEAGLKEIEATSFVSPTRVPQLADARELWPQLPLGPLFSALVPNQRGLADALAVGVNRIAIFTASSETFTQRNIGMTIQQSIDTFGQVVSDFRASGGGFVRGYLSTAFECPYEGRIDPAKPLQVARKLFDLGIDEISIGDTIGVAGPAEITALGNLVKTEFGTERVAWHFHDTWGTGLANAIAALELGFTSFDASAAGLGGCPFAPGAGGNLATEDLVYALERLGVPTGVDLPALAAASGEVLEALGRPAVAKAQCAVLARGSQR